MKLNLLIIGVLILQSIGIAQTLTNKIVIDQFGYRPNSKKIAVLRNPQTGFDADEFYFPGNLFAVVKESNASQVFLDAPVTWGNGQEDASSGDKAWWFDFSSVTAPGEYYILDINNNVKSYSFSIADDVYNEVLKQAMRVWFYQRSGFAKSQPYAELNWIDGASHIGPLQDLKCRSYLTPNDVSSERDVHGGWFDAGDYNKYSTWTANYIVDLLRAYRENSEAWQDNYTIPESGNGIADIIDEVKWGMDHLLRMQKIDGSIIAVVSADNASPPSSAKGSSLYGGVNTLSTLSSSGAFALGAIVFEELGYYDYADTLLSRAEKAWEWADANPRTLWFNNDPSHGTQGIGAGQQEQSDDYKRIGPKLRAAAYLFEKTNNTIYQNYFESNYDQLHMFTWNFAYPFEDEEQDILLEYSRLNNASQVVKEAIVNKYKSAMEKEHNFQAFDNAKDPYMAHMDAYTWGSSRQKCSNGLMFWNIKHYNIDSSRNADAIEAAEDFIHYMHGVNPLNLVYLTNMSRFGAENSCNQIYHTWFSHGTDWDDASSSKYGPVPGIVPGGANPSYDVDGCCPNDCGSPANNEKCSSDASTHMTNQPKQKSYYDFNESWPLNSWSVTENSMGYQVEYIRLLSKFVQKAKTTNKKEHFKNTSFKVYPNPTNSLLHLSGACGVIDIIDYSGRIIRSTNNQNVISVEELSSGIYMLKNQGHVIRIIKK